MMPQLELRTLPLENLIPAPYNPRKTLAPSSPAYRKLRASLEEFGLVEPLIWNAETGHVVGGHLRLRILRELGCGEVPVSVVHLSPSREKALNVVLNNQEAQGRYDRELLAQVLEDLQELPELPLTGFDASTLSVLRFEPVDEQPAESESRMEITLLLEPSQYAAIEGELNRLIRDYSLEVHIRDTVAKGQSH